MKRVFKKIAIVFGLIVLAVILTAAYFVYRITKVEEVEALKPEENVLKTGSIELDNNTDPAIYLDYLKQNAKTPTDYVIEKFRTHDVVILGEYHQFREDCQLICQLIEPLYRRAGVRVLAMEVLRQKDSDALSSFLADTIFDQSKATAFFRVSPDFYWGFKEYEDILKSVWELNHSLAQEEPKFRVIGLSPDFDGFALMFGSLPRKIIGGLLSFIGNEKSMADFLGDKVLQHKEKALVQIGYHHSFTRYKEPKVFNYQMLGERVYKRFGGWLFEKYGNRIFQVCLHQKGHNTPGMYTGEELPERSSPLISLLEQLYYSNGGQAIGFDVEGSPLALLRDSGSPYFTFQKYVTFGDIAQGYIIQKSLDQLTLVSWTKGFVDDSNLAKLRIFAIERKHWIGPNECQTANELENKFSQLLSEGKRF